MNKRIKLDCLLKKLTPNVYYQPPESVRINYPAIIYSRERNSSLKADNINYLSRHQYKIIVIDKNPDSEIVEEISQLPYCRFSSHYTQNNLNYDVFSLYYDE